MTRPIKSTYKRYYNKTTSNNKITQNNEYKYPHERGHTTSCFIKLNKEFKGAIISIPLIGNNIKKMHMIWCMCKLISHFSLKFPKLLFPIHWSFLLHSSYTLFSPLTLSFRLPPSLSFHTLFPLHYWILFKNSLFLFLLQSSIFILNF